MHRSTPRSVLGYDWGRCCVTHGAQVPFVMDGPSGCVSHIEYLLEAQGHAIVVLAEGAGQEYVTQARGPLIPRACPPLLIPSLKISPAYHILEQCRPFQHFVSKSVQSSTLGILAAMLSRTRSYATINVKFKSK